MKLCKMLAILMTVLALGPIVGAQTCTSPILGWQGNFSLSANGSGTDPRDGEKWKVNESAADTSNLSTGGAFSCTTAIWWGINTNATGSVGDNGTKPCPPHSARPTSIDTITGSAVYSGPQIRIDLSKNTYSFLPAGFGNVTINTKNCDGTSSTTPDLGWPIYAYNWVIPTIAGPAFSLPSTIQSLTENVPSLPGVWIFGQFPISWSLSFTLDPIIDDTDDPCKQSGGSAIGCQNQSLGEDVPVTDTPFTLHYESERMPGRAGANSRASADALATAGWTVNVHHVYDPGSQSLYLGDGNRRSGWQLGTPPTLSGTLLVTSEDGREVYVFDALSGNHIKTVKPLTGALKYQFTYNPAGNLVTIADVNSNITTIKRYSTNAVLTKVTVSGVNAVYSYSSFTGSVPIVGEEAAISGFSNPGNNVSGTVTAASGGSSGTFTLAASTQVNETHTGSAAMFGPPTAIVSPFGQTTTLNTDAHGFLNQVTDPAGHSVSFAYDKNGLMTGRRDANGNNYTYTYDSTGRLTNDADPAGGFTSETRTKNLSGNTFTSTVTQTTAMGQTSTFQTTRKVSWTDDGTSYAEQRVNTWPSGLHASVSKTLQTGQIVESTALPDSSSDKSTSGPDPRWGLQVPIAIAETSTLGSLTMNTTRSRTATLGTVDNPFSLTVQTDKETINGRTYTSVFTTANLTAVDTTPVGRKVTTVLDTLERASSTQISGLTPTTFAYDSRGRLASLTRGTRIASFNYDADGRLAAVTDPLKLKISFTYDADGRLLATTLPDGRIITRGYDANGNLTSLTPPGKTAHDFTYTAVNLVSEYLPPSATGSGPTTYSYNADRLLTGVTRPDGKTINLTYDSAGRPSSVVTPSSTISYAYSSTTGNLTSASITGGEGLTYAYNGPLPTLTTWTGTVAGNVSDAYNNNFWVTSRSIDGANTTAFTYDNDGLITKAGALSITRATANGLIAGTALGSATDARTYNSFGELTGYKASYHGAPLYSVTYTRDADSRVSAKTETVGGTTNTFAYTYDAAGRLTGVSESGKSISAYTYDTNSNRTKAVTAAGTVAATYDAQDRLLTYGATTYAYTANGELASKTVGTQKTTYQYDVLGNLVSVTLPSGKAITYVIDAENRPVGRKVNGTLVEGSLYDGDSIIAQLNGSNGVVSQFIYASGSAAPDYMIEGGVTYRIFSDQLGSPRLVVNTSTGAIAERIDYDEFGNVILDTKPGFQPFGFAGGLYDQDTKLVHFGARDYNPSVGQWTAKDPILFSGGGTNLYEYVLNDPVNMVDPAGTDGYEECSACKETKKAGKKILKMYGKTLNVPQDKATSTIQKGIQEETKPQPFNEYKQQVERAKERADDSVDPVSRWLRTVWRKCANSLAGDSGN